MDRFIESFDTSNFNRLISSASVRIFVSLPNLHKEIALKIFKAKERVSNIKIIVDCAEDSFRNGYGSTESIDILKATGVEIFESPKNRVSFIISDEKGYFIFPESRIFVHDDVGNNAVKMDPVTQVHLISYFFPSIRIDEGKEQLKNDFIESTKRYVRFIEETLDDIENPQAQILVAPINEENFSKVKQNLKKIPALHPDLQRQINTYTAKIQFAELNFEGANFHIKKIKIPPKALPFKDEEIKKALEAKMRLFEDLHSKDEFKEFFEIDDKVKDLRKQFCKPITSRRKNVIAVENKQKFVAEVEIIKKEIDRLSKIISEHLDSEILSSKERIQNELMRFLKDNPPEEIKSYQTELFNRKTKDIVSQILNSIKYPEPSSLLKKMSLRLNFYDLTFEDFKDDNFLNELKK